MNPLEICQAGKRFVDALIPLEGEGRLNVLLTPENVEINGSGATLRNTAAAPWVQPGIHAGYSAPELYEGRPGPGTPVYYVGAVLYQMLKGIAPPDAQKRAGQPPLVQPGTPLADVINTATELEPEKRFASLQVLRQVLGHEENALLAAQPATQAAPFAQAPAPAAQPAAPAAVHNPEASTIGPPPPVAVAQPAPTPAPAQQPVFQQPAPQQPVPQAGPAGYVPGAAPVQGVAPVSAVAQAQPAAPGAQQQPGHMPPSSPPLAVPPAGAQGQAGYAAQPGQGYPGAPAQPYGVQPAGVAPQKPKKKKKGLIIALVSVLVVAGLAVGGYFGFTESQKKKVNEAYASGDYSTVVSTLDSYSWIMEGNEQKYDYSRARTLMEEGKEKEALKVLDGLDGFEDSKNLAQGIRYGQAKALMDSGQLEESLAMFEALGKYEDSAALASQLDDYLNAADLADPLERYEAYGAMDGFLDSADKANQAAGEIYDDAMSDYDEGWFFLAWDSFDLIPEYKDAAQYSQIIDLWSVVYSNTTAADQLDAMRALSTEINAGPIVMSDDMIQAFLDGSWSSGDGGEYFDLNLSTMLYEFPDSFKVVGNYNFYGNQMVSSTSGPLVTFEYISFDEIKITVENAGTFTYTRD